MCPSGDAGTPPLEGPGMYRTWWDVGGCHPAGARRPGPRSRSECACTATDDTPLFRGFDSRSSTVPQLDGRSSVNGFLPDRRSTHHDNRFVGCRAVGGDVVRPGCPDAGGSPPGGRPDGSGTTDRTPAHRTWFREVNSSGWERCRGDEPHGRMVTVELVCVDQGRRDPVPDVGP